MRIVETGKKIKFHFKVWIIGIITNTLRKSLVLIGKIKIKGIKNLNEAKKIKPLIIISNHKSYWEGAIIASLFLPEAMLEPKTFPYNTVDQINVTDKWYMRWARDFLITVKKDKNGERKDPIALRRIIKILQNEGRVIIFPSGGFRHYAYRIIVESPIKHEKMIKFQNGIGLIVKRTGAKILPIFVRGPGLENPNNLLGEIEIIIGKVIEIKDEDPERITRTLEKIVLELADSGIFSEV